MEVELTLIRNGITEYEKEGLLPGLTEAPLCSESIKELEKRKRAQIYPDVDLVYTGASRQCVETANAIYKKPALVLHATWAFDLGQATGRRYKEMIREPGFRNWALSEEVAAFPDGLSPYDSIGSILREFEGILKSLEVTGIKKVSLIAHRAALLLLLNRFMLPCYRYSAIEIPWGGGCTVLCDTDLSTFRMKKTF